MYKKKKHKIMGTEIQEYNILKILSKTLYY